MTNYQSLALIISEADTLATLKGLEDKLVKFYDWQVINERELARLDIKLCDRINTITEGRNNVK